MKIFSLSRIFSYKFYHAGNQMSSQFIVVITHKYSPQTGQHHRRLDMQSAPGRNGDGPGQLRDDCVL
jgi:hypothetical protein